MVWIDTVTQVSIIICRVITVFKECVEDVYSISHVLLSGEGEVRLYVHSVDIVVELNRRSNVQKRPKPILDADWLNVYVNNISRFSSRPLFRA